ncbi:MAG: adenylate/guanylate cyclase domain-containing protein, partial [Acidimicrobiia bacterium]
MTTTLPTGILTFLFTDIEGSTKLVDRVGSDEYANLLGIHHQAIRDTVAADGGVVVMSEGDAFFVVFTDQSAAVHAAIAAQHAISENADLHQHGLLVRMGLHTDEATLGGDNYVGIGVHIAARISAAAHGGQILVSDCIAASLVMPDAAVRDLGTYWLKDIPTPEGLHQVVGPNVRDGFAPVAASPTTPYNAPAVLSTFVGRDADVERGLDVLGASRLVTLTGPGGTGKTRLSLAIGSALTNRFSDGVFFVPLAGITDAAGVVTAMLDALDAPPATGTTSPNEYLAAYLANRETLLVVDNFEQVLDAADILAKVLGASARSRILVTSRIPLGVTSEQEMHIEPLVQTPAVELFIDRATSVKQGFEVDDVSHRAIEEIVRRLDGLPLAIELAAARVRMMTPLQIADTLTPLTLGHRAAGTPAHQQTLNDTIRWSYDLLSEAEQRLLTRLSVFIGGAALDEVIAVCDPEAIGLDPIAGLDALVTQNLLVADSAGNEFRVRMLETIREFGLVMLAETGELDEMFSRHLDAYLRLAESAVP